MTKNQIRWREALTNPLASSKIKRSATIGLLGSGIPLEIIKAWAKMGATEFRK
jgi:hypothetical protein